MAPPNTLFIPEIAQPHAMADYFEIMDFLSTAGLIDFIPDAARGGNYVERPMVGQLSAGAERADVAGTLTTAASTTTTTNLNHRMVTLHRTLYHSYFISTPIRAGMTPEQYSAEIGRQIAIKFAQKLLSDVYGIAHASCQAAALDHEHDVYVDTTTAGSQVDYVPTTLLDGKFKMTDHMESLDWAVAHSKQFNDMRTDQITNADNVVPNIVGDLMRGTLFRNILGVNHIVDDQIGTETGPTTTSPTKYRALLLRSRAMNPAGAAPVTVSFQTPLRIDTQHVLSGQVRENELQGYAAWAIGIPGSQWDSTNGGANPTDAALITATNWDESNDDDEQHGIVRVVTN